jgi:endonuclease YncB( thermonuclease family)
MTESGVGSNPSALAKRMQGAGQNRFTLMMSRLRPVIFAMAACSLCFISEGYAGRPKGGGGRSPQPRQQPNRPAPVPQEWEEPEVPQPRSRRVPRRSQNQETPNTPSRTMPNFHRDHEPGGTRDEAKPAVPLPIQQPSNTKPALEHHVFVRRHHRHVVPWVVGYPSSLGWYVESVSSGNTIRARNPANLSQPVRLFGVAAPAEGQAFFSESRDRLSSQIVGTTVYVQSMGPDTTGTLVAKVFYGSAYMNERQVFDGMALYDADQGIDPNLANAQIAAQEAGRGIWGDADAVSDWAYAE